MTGLESFESLVNFSGFKSLAKEIFGLDSLAIKLVCYYYILDRLFTNEG